MKQVKFFKSLMMLIFFLSAFNVSFGQYKGPGSKETTDKIFTVKEIKDNASMLDRSDVLVRVKGYIVRQINSDTYEFKDNTGVIQVEMEKKKLPVKPFDDKTELILIGEVDHDLLEPVELEVEEVIFVSP